MLYTEHIHMDPPYRARLRACGLDTVAKVLARVDGRVAAWSRTTDTLFVPGPDGAPGFYVKRHFFPTWAKRLRGALRGTFFGRHRGLAETQALGQMRWVGVPAVRPVAYGARRVLHFLAACFLITEEVPGAVNLTTFADDVRHGRRTLTPGQRRALRTTLAEQLAHMHLAGCSHGNLFWRNLLVRYGPDGRPEFFFLDPQPLHSWERLSPGSGWWLRELAQVMASALPFTTPGERLRFLRRYLGDDHAPEELRRQLLQIERLASGWRRHEERRIRMNGLFEVWNRQLAAELSRAADASSDTAFAPPEPAR
ncbi:MAG: lipopolysaccharide kinase InaA family protein [Planctomycetota bacterium]